MSEFTYTYIWCSLWLRFYMEAGVSGFVCEELPK